MTPSSRLRIGLGICVAWLILGACGTDQVRSTGTIPALPRIDLNAFVPDVRAKLRPALRAAEASPQDAQASGELAMVLHAHDQLALAETCYRRANLLDPGSLQWQYYLGTVLLSQRKSAAAADLFRRALEIDPNFVPLQLSFAESLSLAGESVESESEYRSIIARESQLPQAHLGLGNVLVSRGAIAAAIPHFERACELDPDYAEARYALALAYRDAGLVAESEEQFALYRKTDSGPPAIPDPFMARVRRLKDSAPDRVSRGIRMASQGRTQEAIAEHERALELDPSLTQAHSNLMTLNAKLERLGKAQEHYALALELNPDQAELHYNYGVLMFERSRFGEAGSAFRKALAINPNYAEAHNNLGQVLERENRLAEALEHYLQAVANKPNYRLAHFHLGRMQIARGLREEAVASFERALEPKDEMAPTVLYALAAANVQLGRPEEALRHGRRAEQLAASYGQHELAARIRTDLQSIAGQDKHR